MQLIAMFFAALLAIAVGTLPSRADRRVALVIGNAAYRTMTPLKNPKNDAEDVGAELRRLGFIAIVATDLDHAGMNAALAQFSNLSEGADIAVLYYSGHGMQFNGKNYLLPVEARITSVADVNTFQLTPLDDMIETLQGVRGAGVVILDACRNNPVEADLRRSLAAGAGTRGDVILARGLASPPAPHGRLIAYATQANDVAADGDGRNSPFTTALLKHLPTPDLDIRSMMNRVQDDVYDATNPHQRPEVVNSIVGAFRLNGGAVAPPPSPPAIGSVARPADDADEHAWLAIQNTVSIAVLEEFRRQHPGSRFDAYAAARIDELRRQAPTPAPVVVPTPVAPPTAAVIAPSAPPPDEVAWSFLRDTRDPEQLRRFMLQYPNSARRSEAAQRVAELEAERQIAPRTPALAPYSPPQPTTFRPSFDCATHFQPDESAVCGNRTLSSLDVDLDRLYGSLRNSLAATRFSRLRDEQRNWLKLRGNCRDNVACLLNVYRSRIAELNSWR